MDGRLIFFALAFTLVDCACEPSCREHNVGDAIPDPLDSHNFYICLEDLVPTPAPFPCPEEEDFDSHTFTCKDSEDPYYECDKSCFTCEHECGSKSLISDPWDCSVFYECVDGAEGPARRCADEEPFFDGYSCQSEESKCCSCLAYCNSANVGRAIPDPQNCIGYYQCLHRGPAQESHHKYCSDGHFDYLHQKCSITFPCLGICYDHPPNECVETFVCETEGFFPKCPNVCNPNFYQCEVNDIGFVVAQQQCPNELVFDPVSLVCIQKQECPIRM